MPGVPQSHQKITQNVKYTYISILDIHIIIYKIEIRFHSIKWENYSKLQENPKFTKDYFKSQR